MKRALLLALLTFVVGALLGWGARRLRAAVSLPEPRRRAPLVRQALEAYEKRQASRLGALLAEAEGREDLEAEDRAELRLLGALAEADVRSLLELRRDAPGTHAAARAAWEATLRTADPELRRRREEDFRRRHPDAWVLGRRRP